MVHRIYSPEHQLNKANASDADAVFLDLNLSFHNDTVSTKIYDQRDDLYFDIVIILYRDGDIPLRFSYDVYISQPIRMLVTSIAVTHVKLLKQGYWYHKLHKAFTNFTVYTLKSIEIYHVSIKKLLQQGISNPYFYMISLRYTMVVHVYVAIMHECQRVHHRTYTCTNHGISDLYHYIQPMSSYS